MSTPQETIAALRQHNKLLRTQAEAMRQELARYENEVLRLSQALEEASEAPEILPPAPPQPSGVLAWLGRLRRS